MHYNYKEICIICQIYLDFHPRNEEPSWLWMCKHKHIQKMPEWHFFNYFLKNKVLKNLILIPRRGEGGGVRWSPTLILSEVGRRKAKPNRCVESFLKWGIYIGTQGVSQKFPIWAVKPKLEFLSFGALLWRPLMESAQKAHNEVWGKVAENFGFLALTCFFYKQLDF